MKTVTKYYDVSEIKRGYFVCWNVCSQAMYKSTIVLKDKKTGREYFNIKKTNPSTTMQFLGQGYADVAGDELQLIVTSEVDTDLYQSINSYNVTDNNAKTVGHGYNFCFEDGSDNDFNDVYVNLIGWKNKG